MYIWFSFRFSNVHCKFFLSDCYFIIANNMSSGVFSATSEFNNLKQIYSIKVEHESFSQEGPSHTPTHMCNYLVNLTSNGKEHLISDEGRGESKNSAKESCLQKVNKQVKKLLNVSETATPSRSSSVMSPGAVFNTLKQKLNLDLPTESFTLSEKEGFTCKLSLAMNHNGKKKNISIEKKGTQKKKAKDNCLVVLNQEIQQFFDYQLPIIAAESKVNNEIQQKVESLPQFTPSLSKKKDPSKVFLTPTDESKGRLGRGGFGQVYCVAKQDLPEKLFAMKVSLLKSSEDEIGKKRFQNEYELLKRVQECEFVVRLRQTGDDLLTVNGYLAFLMDYHPCGSLAAVRKHRFKGEMPPALVCRLHKEVAQAIKFLHKSVDYEERITHNDLNPRNVLVTDDFHARLTDFGGSTMALHTTWRDSDYSADRDLVAGTAFYAAPERDDFPGKPCDVYTLGVCLWECLSSDLKVSDGAFHELYARNPRKLTQSIRDRLSAYERGGDTSQVAEADVMFALWQRVMVKCCRPEHERRPKIDQVCERLRDVFEMPYARENCERAVREQQGLKVEAPLRCDSTWVDISTLKTFST